MERCEHQAGNPKPSSESSSECPQSLEEDRTAKQIPGTPKRTEAGRYTVGLQSRRPFTLYGLIASLSLVPPGSCCRLRLQTRNWLYLACAQTAMVSGVCERARFQYKAVRFAELHRCPWHRRMWVSLVVSPAGVLATGPVSSMCWRKVDIGDREETECSVPGDDALGRHHPFMPLCSRSVGTTAGGFNALGPALRMSADSFNLTAPSILKTTSRQCFSPTVLPSII